MNATVPAGVSRQLKGLGTPKNYDRKEAIYVMPSGRCGPSGARSQISERPMGFLRMRFWPVVQTNVCFRTTRHCVEV